MCGICGALSWAHHPPEESISVRMLQALSHRGPDGSGVVSLPSNNGFLGNTRLAVIGLEAGKQPYTSRCGRYIGVMNGEVYNFRAIQRDLARSGTSIETDSDTELVIEGFANWGAEILSFVRGMFAIAIYDTHLTELFLARDRAGVKPLYYFGESELFVFGSEMKSLLMHPGVPRNIDSLALHQYLALGYPLLPRTAFKKIFELEPGTSLRVSPGQMKREVYWRWPDRQVPVSDQGREDGVREALIQAVEENLVADVEVGACLSAGIDSTLLVAIVRKELQRPLRTFTVRFPEASYDESQLARLVASHFGADHHEITLDGVKDPMELIAEILDQFDQPFADSSAIPMYLLSKEIRRWVKVALSGDGGDEMFGGYPRFRHIRVARALGSLPKQLLSGFVASGLRSLAPFNPDLSRAGGRLLTAALSEGWLRCIALSSYMNPDDVEQWIAPQYTRGNADPFELPISSVDGSWRDFMSFSEHYALPGDYLTKVDTMS
ncbi:MAG: asparagine synthase (glutamine-hydrolyzing), partial [Bdellovibrionales bacterium]|nr:asparagine synthase (glutamine-hydrolyzing) [Bdellovibrionales bacterium]